MTNRNVALSKKHYRFLTVHWHTSICLYRTDALGQLSPVRTKAAGHLLALRSVIISKEPYVSYEFATCQI